MRAYEQSLTCGTGGVRLRAEISPHEITRHRSGHQKNTQTRRHGGASEEERLWGECRAASSCCRTPNQRA